MHTIEVRNVHEALKKGMMLLAEKGIHRESRNGDVLVMPEPVTTIYQKPTERVLFWDERDANPFFHFMEGLWMLAGRNDVAWISQFSSNIGQYSDDGVTFHAPYGYRWINHFAKQIPADPEVAESGGGLYVPFNQLETIAEMLKKNPFERRCVLQMWDAEIDLNHQGKDIPCNTQIYFKIGTDGRLNMTVLNRSNDIIWGAYGANAVHMSMLQEFMAAWIGVPVGRYWQVSNDWHAYVDVFEKHNSILTTKDDLSPYEVVKNGKKLVSPFPMVNSPIDVWLEDLSMFMEVGPVPAMRDVFFRKVAGPIWSAWFAWKNKDDKRRIDTALYHLSSCKASDWRLACEEWLERRRK